MQCACAILSFMACSSLQYFSALSHKRHGLRKKKRLLPMKCGFLFPLQSLSEKFLILERTEQDVIKTYIRLHVKYWLLFSSFKETWIFSIYFSFRKIHKCKNHENPSSASGVVVCGQTDRHDEADSRFS